MTEKNSHLTPAVPRKRTYSTSRQVRQRYGGRSAMWLWRKLKADPRFPRPLAMGPNLRLFDDQELDRYDDALRAEGAALSDGEVA